MSTSKRMILLKSSDGESFEVEEAVATQSETIKNMMEGDCTIDNGIPLGNVTGKVLAKVIEYCKRHADSDNNSGRGEGDLKSFDSEFVKVDLTTLFDLILAANFLHIKGLLDLTSEAVADMIKGKTPQEISRAFNIENFNPEEEEQIRQENAWAFE